MAYDYDLLAGRRLLYAFGFGDFTPDDGLNLWTMLMSDRGVAEEHVTLINLLGVASVTTDASTNEKLLKLMEQSRARFPERVAVVASHPDAWKLGKQWELYAETLHRQCIVFPILNAACVWLGFGPDIVEEMPAPPEHPTETQD